MGLKDTNSRSIKTSRVLLIQNFLRSSATLKLIRFAKGRVSMPILHEKAFRRADRGSTAFQRLC